MIYYIKIFYLSFLFCQMIVCPASFINLYIIYVIKYTIKPVLRGHLLDKEKGVF
jgi:hypothetical protein